MSLLENKILIGIGICLAIGVSFLSAPKIFAQVSCNTSGYICSSAIVPCGNSYIKYGGINIVNGIAQEQIFTCQDYGTAQITCYDYPSYDQNNNPICAPNGQTTSSTDCTNVTSQCNLLYNQTPTNCQGIPQGQPGGCPLDDACHTYTCDFTGYFNFGPMYGCTPHSTGNVLCTAGGGSGSVCGDGVCSGAETSLTCPADCSSSAASPTTIYVNANPSVVSVTKGVPGSDTANFSVTFDPDGHRSPPNVYSTLVCPTGFSCAGSSSWWGGWLDDGNGNPTWMTVPLQIQALAGAPLGLNTFTIIANSNGELAQTTFQIYVYPTPCDQSVGGYDILKGCGYYGVNFGTLGAFAPDGNQGTDPVDNFTAINLNNFGLTPTPPMNQPFLATFSLRWTGSFYFSGGNYTFTLDSDDGSRLYIDNNLVVDYWLDHTMGSPRTYSTSLSAGTHNIKLEMYQSLGNYGIYLAWAKSTNGVCGTANGKIYSSQTSSYGTDTQCAAGTSSNSAFPNPGSGVTWVCQGQNGGSNSGGCSAQLKPADACTPGNCGGCSAGVCSGGGGGSLVTVTAVQASCPATGIVLSWPTAAGASSYNIYRNTINTVPGSVYQTTATNSFTDNSAGGPYYYWVETVGGGLSSSNKVAANTNNSGGISANTCGPNSPGSGGGACNTNTCSPTPTGGGSNPACSIVRLFWVDNSTNETGFKLYVDGSYITTVPTANQGGIGGQMSYDYTPVDSNPHSYSVAATNSGGDSSQVTISAVGGIAASACGANLSDSDKDIIAINGVAINYGGGGASACNASTQPLPSGVSLKLGDVLTFKINLCNDLGAGPASSLSVSEKLLNIQMPTAGWNVIYNGTALTQGAGANQYSLSGSVPNQTMTINLAGNSIAKGGSGIITFNGQLTVPSGFTGSVARFQNCFTGNYFNGSVNSSVNSCTPLLPFTAGRGVPTINEVP